MSSRDTWHRGETTVTCIACGESVTRSDAREYDRHGDRWDREGKSFEFLCKPCDRERCHADRDGLEDRLVEAGAGERDRGTFLSRFLRLEQSGRTTGPDGQ